MFVTLTTTIACWPAFLPDRWLVNKFDPVHGLVLEHLTAVLSGAEPLGHMHALSWPDGVSVQVIAWPHLLLALALRPLFGTMGALGMAGWGALLASGLVMVAALRRAGLEEPGPTLAGAAWAAHPMALAYLSHGQLENCAGFALAGVLLGLCTSGRRGLFIIGISTLLAVFSSPYQAVIAVLLSVIGAIFLRGRHLLPVVLASGLACALALPYYGQRPPPGMRPMGPGPGQVRTAVNLDSLWAPSTLLPDGTRQWWWGRRCLATPRRCAEALAAGLTRTVITLPQKELSYTAPRFDQEHATYLGVLLSGLGLTGLLIRVRHRLAGPVLLSGLLGLLLALGDGPLFSVAGLEVPGPWWIATRLPGLERMGNSYRFVGALALASCVGLGLLLDGARLPSRALRGLAVGIGLLALADGLAFSPRGLPHATRALVPPAGYDALPQDAIWLDLPASLLNVEAQGRAFLEGATPDYPPLVALLLHRPLVFTLSAGPSELVADMPLVRAAEDGSAPEPQAVHASLAALHAAGIDYIALHTRVLDADQARQIAAAIEQVAGPPDASGDGVLGWRLGEGPAEGPGEDR